MISVNEISGIKVVRAPGLVREHEAADYLGVSVTTLRRDRVRSVRSIPVVNIGATVRYSLVALDAWILTRMNSGQTPTSNELPTLPPVERRKRGRPRKSALTTPNLRS